MDNDPSKEQWLEYKTASGKIAGPQRAVLAARLAQYKAVVQMNRANEMALYHQILAEATAAEG